MKHELLRRREVDFRGGSHCASRTGLRDSSPKCLCRIKSQNRAASYTEDIFYVHMSGEHLERTGSHQHRARNTSKCQIPVVDGGIL
jgi:hypothetical protein